MLPVKNDYAACFCIQLLSMKIQDRTQIRDIYMPINGLYELAT